MLGRDVSHSPVSSFQSVDQTYVNTSIATETYQTLHPDNMVEYFKFKKGRDSPSEARSALLVIAVLVVTATFQV